MALFYDIGSTDPTPAELRHLEEQQLCSHSSTAGKIQLSSAFLSSPPQIPSSSSSSSTSSITVSFRNFHTDPNQTFNLPIAAESVEALEFVHFVPETANEIFQNFQNRDNPTTNPDRLIDFVHRHVAALDLPEFEKLSDRQALSRIGLTQRIQDVFLDPESAQIFHTETLHFWVKEMLRAKDWVARYQDYSERPGAPSPQDQIRSWDTLSQDDSVNGEVSNLNDSGDEEPTDRSESDDGATMEEETQ